MIRPVRDGKFKKPGPKAALKRIKCWWNGEHQWDDPSIQQPYPFRKLTCTHCGTKWRYLHTRGTCPAPMGEANTECPNCLMVAWYDPNTGNARCIHCGWKDNVHKVELVECEYCGRTIEAGAPCKHCGA